MKSSHCSAQQIFELNSSKEYTLTATPILEKALTDNRLTAQAAKLWQFLFGKSKYDKNLCVKISYSKLAKEFNKSTRTISRWVKSLSNVGYLIIQHNYNSSGSQLKNTLLIRIPEDVYLHAQTAKDRKSKDTFVQSTIGETEIEVSENSAGYTETENEPSRGISDNFVRGEGDNFVLHKDISSKQEIIRNNNIENNVVVFEVKNNNCTEDTENETDIYAINREITSLKKQVTNLERSLDIINKDDTVSDKSDKLYPILCEIRELSSHIDFLESKKERLLCESEKKQDIKSLSENIAHIRNAKGERAISSFTFKRLVARLSAMGYSGKNLTQLVNEILFEVRFGSLRQSTEGDDLNTEKAVNIGIKLVREKRWTTPSGLM